LQLTDERTEGSALATTFTGTLTAPQARAVAELAAGDIGVLCAPPGAGKTVMGVRLIALRGRSTLILVHRKLLVEQWVARLREFLDIDSQSIGTVGGARSKASGVIDVATVQGLARITPDAEMLAQYGQVIIDECHHVPAVSIERLLGSCPARYVTGLTATPYRRDGHQPIISMQCGPTRHVMNSASSGLGALRVVRRDTGFDPSGLPPDPGIQEVYSALAADSERLELVAADTLALLAEGRRRAASRTCHRAVHRRGIRRSATRHPATRDADSLEGHRRPIRRQAPPATSCKVRRAHLRLRRRQCTRAATHVRQTRQDRPSHELHDQQRHHRVDSARSPGA
jgi:hypothetical protein